ncbi:uncharacterized protein LOC111718232 [Eurytemora carolleeae]|uniref:uncharacterized protein LOC111718232 n=1 Tax=Eurytemora carolleeae TaxID=1294199 RepID=UPI000C76D73C|nr:uncharacterized protein LOC111718232 [Eurytemora carolleeae]XP_023349543.1 uncharacterized protein LOC111718232 [Eurytemora carolleeae]|eukprot:XP_023349542.1 uncharacterized protein LOC111718232 [Eurytemora affinis]
MLLILLFSGCVSSYPFNYQNQASFQDDGGFNILENLGHEFPLEYYQEADLPVNLYHDLPESSLYHDLSESNLYRDLPSPAESNMPLNPYSELNWRDLDTQVLEEQPIYRDVMEAFLAEKSLDAGELPWYTETRDTEDLEEENFWPVDQNSNKNDEPTNDDLKVESELKRMIDTKRSDEQFESYLLKKNPVISTRKNTKSPNANKRKETASENKESVFPPEKRGMPEEPIFRPGAASDPVVKPRSSPISSDMKSRSKRSLLKPVPFFPNQD